MHNLYRSRLPVLLMAGKAPFTTHGELTGTRDSCVAVQGRSTRRASCGPTPSGNGPCRRASSPGNDAPAPAASCDRAEGADLMLPREILTESGPTRRAPSRARFRRAGSERRRPEAGRAAGRRCSPPRARSLLVSMQGRTPGASSDRAARRIRGIRVFEANMVSNIAHDTPCFIGFAPGIRDHQADFGLLVNVDVPYFRATRASAEATFWSRSTSTW